MYVHIYTFIKCVCTHTLYRFPARMEKDKNLMQFDSPSMGIIPMRDFINLLLSMGDT